MANVNVVGNCKTIQTDSILGQLTELQLFVSHSNTFTVPLDLTFSSFKDGSCKNCRYYRIK